MTMKSFYACLFILILISPLAGVQVFAQDQSTSELPKPLSADDIIAKMQSKLSLTQDQVAAVTPIIEKYASKREEMRQSFEDGTADKDNLRGQMKQLKADEKQELSQVLSADQMSELERMKGQAWQKQNSGNNDGGSSGSGSGNDQTSSSNGGGSTGSGE